MFRNPILATGSAYAVLALMFSLALAGCDPSADLPIPDPSAIAQLPGDRLVVPGQRVGPVYLNESIDNIEKTLGQPDGVYLDTMVFTGTTSERDFHKYRWGRFGLSVDVADQDPYATARWIYIYSPAWRTANNVGSDTLFKDALYQIVPSQQPGYQPLCETQCFAFDVRGLEIGSTDRYSPLDIAFNIYSPKETYTPANHPWQ